MPPPQFQDADDNDSAYGAGGGSTGNINVSSEFRLNAPQVDTGLGSDHADNDDDSSLSSKENNNHHNVNNTNDLEEQASRSVHSNDPRKSYIPPPKESYSERLYNNKDDEEDEEFTAGRSSRSRQAYAENGDVEDGPQPMTSRGIGVIMCVLVVVFLLVGGLVAVVSIFVSNGGDSSDEKGTAANNNNNNNNGGPTEAPSPTTTTVIGDGTSKQPVDGITGGSTDGDSDDNDDYSIYDDIDILDVAPTLKAIVERGYLKCGTGSRQVGFSIVTEDSAEGFDIDLCRAIAAAIFGKDEADDHVEYTTLSNFGRFPALASGSVDLLALGTTHTMERSVHEPITGEGFVFSTAYIYEGLQFAGQPEFVQCADDFSSTGPICENTVICVLDSSTHLSEIIALYPNARITTTVDSLSLFRNFIDGFCNVVAGEGFGISESVGRELGYLGEYVFGNKVISKEPLALVTRREEDPIWSDFVNWIVEAIIVAEEVRITSETAMTNIKTTNIFGPRFQDMFRNAVGLVGNYQEMYDRWLEPLVPRPAQDKVNDGTTAALFAFPYGNLEAEVSEDAIAEDSKLEQILSRGALQCGVVQRPLFAVWQQTLPRWSGFDVEFCKALAAALFDGLDNRVVYVSFSSIEDGLEGLSSGRIDVLAGAPHTIETDTQGEFTMSRPMYYDGLSFGGGNPELVKCADELETNAIECRDMRVCVEESSPLETRLQQLLPYMFIVSVPTPIDGLIAGDCNVVAGMSEEISISALKDAGYSDISSYTIGLNRFTIVPKVMATHNGDHQWSQFVTWVVSSIVYAEEQQIVQLTADQLMPTIPWFGVNLEHAFRFAVGAVGSYSEIYSRTLADDIPRAEMNKVNQLLKGPQHVPRPGIL